MRPCRGRRRCRRWITEIPIARKFTPDCDLLQERGAVCLTLEELEALRLADLLDLDQEESALLMGISRRAFWNDLMRARKNIATALIYGITITIEGGSYILRGEEPTKDATSSNQASNGELRLLEREIAHLQQRLDILQERRSQLEDTEDATTGSEPATEK